LVFFANVILVKDLGKCERVKQRLRAVEMCRLVYYNQTQLWTVSFVIVFRSISSKLGPGKKSSCHSTQSSRLKFRYQHGVWVACGSGPTGSHKTANKSSTRTFAQAIFDQQARDQTRKGSAHQSLRGILRPEHVS
jgi:hypothetical protein